MYGYSVDRGHLDDGYTPVRELSFRFGHLVSGIIILALSFFVSINYLFIVAVLSILMINSVPGRYHKYIKREKDE